MHEWAGWDGMDIQMDGWLNHQKQKTRMVGSVQWQAGKTNAVWAWAKKRTEKDRKRQKKKNKALNHPSSDERERERERDIK